MEKPSPISRGGDKEQDPGTPCYYHLIHELARRQQTLKKSGDSEPADGGVGVTLLLGGAKGKGLDKMWRRPLSENPEQILQRVG